jgi:hypothetical protein
MKKAREKWLIKGRKENRSITIKEKKAHKIIRNKKKIYMKNATESTEGDQKHINKMKMNQTVNQFKKGYQHKCSIIRNKIGQLAMNTTEKEEIW